MSYQLHLLLSIQEARDAGFHNFALAIIEIYKREIHFHPAQDNLVPVPDLERGG